MTEPSREILEQLAEAMARRAEEQHTEITRSAPEPRPPKQPTMPDGFASDENRAVVFGNAKTFYVDHEFGYPYGSLTMYDGSDWHGLGTLTAQDEQGVMQVAFASSRIDMWWKENGTLMGIRCWKFLT